MAAPLIAAGGRIAAGAMRSTPTVRNAERHTASTPSRVTKAYARRGAGREHAKTVSRVSQQLQRVHQAKETVSAKGSVVRRTMKRVRAIRTSVTLISLLSLFCGVQAFFGLLQLIAYGAEVTGEGYLFGLGDMVVPGATLFLISYLISFIIGFCIMITAAIIYTFSGVRWWQGKGLVLFGFFLILSIPPFASGIPWLFFWIPTVIYTQK